MSTRRVVVAIGAVLALVAGLWWLRASTREDAASATAAGHEKAPPAAPSPTSAPSTPGARPALASAPPADEESAFKKIAIKHTTVQRDGTAGVFTADTLRAIRTAAAPAIDRCIADSFARNPDFRAQPDIKGQVSVVFTARAAAGEITVPQAHVIVNGYNDDALAQCAEQTYRGLRVAAAAQPDAEGTVESGYAMN